MASNLCFDGEDDEEEIELFSSNSSDDFIRGSWEQEDIEKAEPRTEIQRLLGIDCKVDDGDSNGESCNDDDDIVFGKGNMLASPFKMSLSPSKMSASPAKLSTSHKELLGSPEDLLVSPESSQPIERMKLNDRKAGMEGLDKKKINKIIHDASKGSKYYENEKRKEQRVKERIDQMKKELSKFTDADKERALVASSRIVAELRETYDFSRILVHIDMDAFYAAVEMRENPKLKDVPMAVGGNSMLCTSNYLARKFGVRAAMPGFIAKKLCPELVIVPSHFDKYRSVSAQIREIFKEYDPNFSPMSLDEAYLDLTDYLCRNSWKYQDISSARCPSEVIVEEIREKIFQKTQLTASAGIAPNLMLSKICSDLNKPNGQYYLEPNKETIQRFIQELSIRKVFGIGRVTEQMLRAVGVTQCKDLLEQKNILYLLFSEMSFHYFMRVALGKSSNRITHDERKSMSVERTFLNAHGKPKLLNICRSLCEELANDLKKESLQVRNVTLKYKLSSFVTKTRSKTIPYAISTTDQLFSFAKELLLTEIRVYGEDKFELRLMGVRGAHFHQATNLKQNTVEMFFSNNSKKSANSMSSVSYSDNAASDLNNSADNSNNSTSNSNNPVNYLNDVPLQTSSEIVDSKNQKTDIGNKSNSEYPNPKNIETKVECPVCGSLQVNDPVSLNSHIDSCLTKQTIKDIIKEQELNETKNEKKNPGKRKNDENNRTNSSPVAKKKTLKSFWKNR